LTKPQEFDNIHDTIPSLGKKWIFDGVKMMVIKTFHKKNILLTNKESLGDDLMVIFLYIIQNGEIDSSLE